MLRKIGSDPSFSVQSNTLFSPPCLKPLERSKDTLAESTSSTGWQKSWQTIQFVMHKIGEWICWIVSKICCYSSKASEQIGMEKIEGFIQEYKGKQESLSIEEFKGWWKPTWELLSPEMQKNLFLKFIEEHAPRACADKKKWVEANNEDYKETCLIFFRDLQVENYNGAELQPRVKILEYLQKIHTPDAV